MIGERPRLPINELAHREVRQPLSTLNAGVTVCEIPSKAVGRAFMPSQSTMLSKEDIMKAIAMLVSTILFIPTLTLSQLYDLNAPKYDKFIVDPHCVFSSRGPLHFESDPSNSEEAGAVKGRALRVSFLQNELLFYSVVIEVVEFEDVKPTDTNIPSQRKLDIINSYILTGFDVEYGANTGILVDVKFLNWNTWDSFTLSEQENQFLLVFKGEGLIEITPLERE